MIAYYEDFVNIKNPLPNVLLELWRTSDGSNYTLVDPMEDGIARSPLSDVLPENNSMPQIFTQRMDPPLHFEAGDVLGVFNPFRGDSHVSELLQDFVAILACSYTEEFSFFCTGFFRILE